MWTDPELVGDVVVRVYDRGPAPVWYRRGSVLGEWLRFEARLADQPSLRELGSTPSQAVARVVTLRPVAVEEALRSRAGHGLEADH